MRYIYISAPWFHCYWKQTYIFIELFPLNNVDCCWYHPAPFTLSHTSCVHINLSICHAVNSEQINQMNIIMRHNTTQHSPHMYVCWHIECSRKFPAMQRITCFVMIELEIPRIWDLTFVMIYISFYPVRSEWVHKEMQTLSQ